MRTNNSRIYVFSADNDKSVMIVGNKRNFFISYRSLTEKQVRMCVAKTKGKSGPKKFHTAEYYTYNQRWYNAINLHIIPKLIF